MAGFAIVREQPGSRFLRIVQSRHFHRDILVRLSVRIKEDPRAATDDDGQPQDDWPG